MRNGDAWMTASAGPATPPSSTAICRRSSTSSAKEGGEIWTDFYAVPKEAPNRKGGYALINFLLDPAVNAKEVQAHGYPTTDARVRSCCPGYH